MQNKIIIYRLIINNLKMRQISSTWEQQINLSSHLLYKNENVRNHNLPVVLYGCEMWSFAQREEHRLWGKVAGGWRRLHNEELHNLYAPPNIIGVIKSRRMRWTGNVARVRDQKCIQHFDWKTWREEPLGRPRRRRGHIRMDLGEIGWEGVDWIHLAQVMDQWQAVVKTVMNLRVP
jgi:hypothetical protein